MSRTPNWATFQAKRKARERGTEDASGTMEHPGKALLEAATEGRNKRLRLYLETGSHSPWRMRNWSETSTASRCSAPAARGGSERCSMPASRTEP